MVEEARNTDFVADGVTLAKREEVSFSRSQTVDLYQVTFAKDSAWPFLVELGTSARCIQFIDLNRNMQTFELPYTR